MRIVLIEIVPFSRRFDRSGFCSGKSELDEWLIKYARQSESRFETRTFLAVETETMRVVGYYSSRVSLVKPNEADQSLLSSFSHKYPLPAYLLAKLAVDEEFQSRGLGSLLLAHALRRAVEINANTGLQLVVVDAIDNDAAAFYLRYEFARFRDSSSSLFLPMKTVLASFEYQH